MPVKIRSINPLYVPRFSSSQAVITRDLVNGGNMQSDRRFFFLQLRCLSHWQHGSALQEQPLYSHSLSQPFLHSSVYWQPTLHAQSPRHLAERNLLLRTLLNQSLTSLGFKDPLFHYFTWSTCLKCSSPTDQKPITTSDLFHFIFLTTDIYI